MAGDDGDDEKLLTNALGSVGWVHVLVFMVIDAVVEKREDKVTLPIFANRCHILSSTVLGTRQA